ncbi:hypothetical protein KNP414_02536 [Paenibacillus mucilaginosus KNP414]|uniref:Uncharacterized protein n=1 Tax=Paenibacillus mucilaginosus (strain KNP414) TaxID=1036673 RepID=F8FAK8_PAEMK|nr:hypothetical protein KNP414_02536 [Paenibacillus mucilaginosus KNP414]
MNGYLFASTTCSYLQPPANLFVSTTYNDERGISSLIRVLFAK